MKLILKKIFEEYKAFIRANKNLEMIFGGRFFDNIQFYDPWPEPDLGYKSGNESDTELINELNNSLLSASISCNNVQKLNLIREYKINKYIDFYFIMYITYFNIRF